MRIPCFSTLTFTNFLLISVDQYDTNQKNNSVPVSLDTSTNVNNKIFSKIANEFIFTLILNSPLLDQSVVISTLLSNATVLIQTILSKIKIDDSFSANLKSVNQHYVQDLGNALKYINGLNDSSPLPFQYRDLKKQGLSLAILKRLANLSRYQCRKCKLMKLPGRTPNPLTVRCACCQTEACISCYKPEDMDRYTFLCPPCSSKLVELNKFPSSYVSKAAKTSQALEGLQGSQDVLANYFPANISMTPTQEDLGVGQGEENNDKDDNLDCSLDSIASLPCAQASPKSLTQEEPEVGDEDKEEDDEDDVVITMVIEAPKSTQDLVEEEKKIDDDDDGFSLSRKEKKKIEKKKKAKVNNQPQASEDQRPLCRHYSRGTCRHGLHGKTLVDGNKCRFLHPKSCQKWLNNGNHKPNGCQEGRNYNLNHPNLCKDSLQKEIVPTSRTMQGAIKATISSKQNTRSQTPDLLYLCSPHLHHNCIKGSNNNSQGLSQV